MDNGNWEKQRARDQKTPVSVCEANVEVVEPACRARQRKSDTEYRPENITHSYPRMSANLDRIATQTPSETQTYWWSTEQLAIRAAAPG
ncbi:hypothetical protein SAMN05216456_1303 [Devosia crocina]|uniref:Uncharacterized protein n=1 Tax=Devosia crocina TaxID=429728 RepID=A0A1I7N9H3_9HYPH|nr:hypothetical protein [Devosia crocina]SFV31320.1 hypothetical protein SAMN05216456_1303 [Devosia crocina]